MISEDVRKQAAEKLRAAAAQLEAGDMQDALKSILAAIPPIWAELKNTYGPLAKIAVEAKLKEILK